MLVDAPLRKQVLQGGERMVRVDPEGKPSRSEFRLLRAYGDASYVEVVLHTGRTHQIRVHAAHIGAAVAGDPKYGDEAANKRLRECGLRRLFLHAAEFSFRLPEGPEYLLSAALPPELAAVLDRL
jgi:23S rRNA pseudouridine955/2504/2580 synthase